MTALAEPWNWVRVLLVLGLTGRSDGISIVAMKRLRCVNCEMTAGDKSAWIWHGKEVTLPGRPAEDGTPRRTVLWLCPDCAGDIGSSKRCDAFLVKFAKDMADR